MIEQFEGADIVDPAVPRSRREARLAARSIADASEATVTRTLREADDNMTVRDASPARKRRTGGSGNSGGSGRGSGADDGSPRKRKPWPWIVLAILIVLIATAVVGGIFLLQAMTVKDNLQEAKGKITQVVPMIKAGDTAGVESIAADVLELTTESDEIVSNPLWQVAGAIPFVGQNVSAVGETTKATHILVRDAMPIALDLLAVIDVQNLKLEGGGVNLQPFRDAQPQLPAIRAAFEDAQTHVDAINRDEILPFVDENIGQLVDIVDQATPAIALAEEYLPTILSILGDGGERTYALLFQNNAEIRATGGNPGAGAIMTINDGKVELREDEDVLRYAVNGRTGWHPQTIDPAEKAALFEDDTARYSQNFSRTPDFTDTASMVNGLWSESSGGQLDGVISLDPVALSYMLSVAGEVPIEGEEVPVTSENAVSLLLSESYERFGLDGDAADVYFAKVASAVFAKIMGGAWDPLAMIDQVQKSIDEQRIYLWFAQEDQQAMSVELGLDGTVASTNEAETQLGIYLNDASYSKLEYYLSTSMTVTCSAEARTVTTAITMNNAVPSADLSGYTLAWRNESLGYPRTTMLFDVISMALPGGTLSSTEPAVGDRDGWDRSGVYNGREAKSIFVAVPMGESRTVSFTSTVPDDATEALSVRYSPTVTQTPVTIDDSCSSMFPTAE